MNQTKLDIFKNSLLATAGLMTFAVAAYLIIVNIFGIPLEEMDELGKWAIPVLLASGNVMFVLYDICITRMVTLYLLKWQKRFRKLFRH